jgi:hypothetical protein
MFPVYEFPPEHLTGLAQDGDVILKVRFQHASLIKDLGFFTFIPLEKFSPLRFGHLASAVKRDVGNTAYIV